MTDEQLRRLRILANEGGVYGLTHESMKAIQAALDEIVRLQSRVAELELLTGDAGEGTP